MKPGPREGFRWDRSTIVYAIELWHRRHLKTPTKAEWETAGVEHPCRLTVQRVFGSWNNAIREAGFKPRRRGEQKNPLTRRRCPETGRFLPTT
jgi:hypothetical protein